MLGEYWPILLFLAVAAVVGVSLLVFGTVLGNLFAPKGRRDSVSEKLSPYECGFEAFEVGSSRVDLQACKLEYSIVSPK